IRPTIGRVSNYNVVPLAWTMDTVSPMTRTVEDCVVMFEVIAGYDPFDEHSAQVPVADYRGELGRSVHGLRVGLIRDYSLTHVQKAAGDAVRAALKTLEGLGARIEEIAMPSIHGNIPAQLTIESCEPRAYHQQWRRTRAAHYGAASPALSLPVGFDPDGLPVGMQVIGRPFDEGTLFRVGHAYQQVTDWHTRSPRLSVSV